ncbi:MAG: hypothetical protein K2M91_00605 [Lachnospiraceae bacterium]|nr:hypothetical protein [Lachnospiraceae bacterium]
MPRPARREGEKCTPENFLAEIQTEKRTHYAEKILENVNKVNTIVEEMLEFTRTE